MCLNLGQLVTSTAGRDVGKKFLIYEIIDQDYVRIVDGNLRSVQRPKKKKRKHLNLSKKVLRELSHKFENGIRVMDEEVRKAIEENS